MTNASISESLHLHMPKKIQIKTEGRAINKQEKYRKNKRSLGSSKIISQICKITHFILKKKKINTSFINALCRTKLEYQFKIT